MDNDWRGPNGGFYVRINWRAKVCPRGVRLGLASTYLVLLAAVSQVVAQSLPPLVPQLPQRPSSPTSGAAAAAASTTTAGRTAGSFAVSNSGVATYSIPIWAPPGPQGLQPHIALTYNSRVGNTSLGVGWYLSGLSSIYRCNLTYAQDAAPAPVTLTYSDQFCIDGNRLRLSSSDNLSTYGQDRTTYQTEVADFSNVTAHSAAGNGPAYFTVQGKDGLTYTYGNGGNSQVLAAGTPTVLSWLLNEVSDRAGNTMTIAYTTSTGSAVPATISWAPTTHGSSTYNYTMNFSYGTNVPQSSYYGYVTGTSVQNTNLLGSISITSSGNTVKQYVLSYQAPSATQRDLLTQVQECADAGATNCLSPTQITYQNGSAGVSTTATPAITGAAANSVSSLHDFNTDGYSDLLYSNGTDWYVSFGSASGYGTAVSTGISASTTVLAGDLLGKGQEGILANNGGTWYYYTWSGSSFTGVSTGLAHDSTASQYVVADVNGDGLPDLVKLIWNANGITVYVNLNTGNGSSVSFGTAQTAYSLPPIQLAGCAIVSAQLAASSDQVSTPEPLHHFDFNGDGRDDLALQAVVEHFNSVNNGNSCVAPYLDTFSTTGLISTSTPSTASFTATTLAQNTTAVTFLDWNSDNCTDVAAAGTISISGCDGSLPTSFTVPPAYTILGAMDWDGDGRKDLLVQGGTGLVICVSTGDGLGPCNTLNLPYSSSNTYFTFDANGDGLDDLGYITSSGAVGYYLHNGPQPDLLSSVNDGFAMQVSFSYTTLPTGTAYSADVDSTHGGPDPTYPHSGGATLDAVYAGPLTVVSQLSASDGTGGTYTDSFWYYGARMNHQGRGFDGFYAKRTLDSRKPTASSPNGLYTYEYFRRDFPYTGMLWEADTYQPNNSTLMHRLTNSPFHTETLDGTTHNTRELPYVSSSVENSYEAGGTADGSWITQKTTTYAAPDIYGNFPTITVATTDKDSGSPFLGNTFTQVMSPHFSYGTPSADWCIHIPDTVSVQSTLPDGTSQTRHYGSQSLGVDYANCRVTDEYIEAGSSTLAVTTHYDFDACGNHQAVTVTGRNPGGTAMTSRKTTYNFGALCVLPESITTTPDGTTNFTTNISYNYSFGVPSQLQDPNGIITKWTQDPYGRRLSETRPDGTVSYYTYYNCLITACGGPSDLRLSVFRDDYGTDNVNIGSEGRYWDGLNRFRYDQRMHAFGTIVNEQIHGYDALGRTIWSYQPVSSGSNGYTAFLPDLLDRPASATLYQSNGTVDRTASWAYAGRTTTITDPRSYKTTQVSDVMGRLRRVTDPAPGGTTSYDYDWFGNLSQVIDPIGTPSAPTYKATYNLRGSMTQMVDADRGTWNYGPDSLNELVSWNDANDPSFTFTAVYDLLGRMTSRTEKEGTSTWTWGSSAAAYNIGSLQAESGYGYAESRTYDPHGRLQTRVITTDQAYQYDYAYNAVNGALDTITYPTSPAPTGTTATRYKIQYAYSYGFPIKISDITQPTAATLWTLSAANDYYSATSESFGSGSNVLSVSHGYKAWTDELTSMQAGVSGSTTNRQNLAYQWDVNGNLAQRQDLNQALTEVFTRDPLNRLQSSTLNANPPVSVSYVNTSGVDQAGNIMSRSDVGSYIYGDALHPHAVTAAGTGTGSYAFTYDKNGNAITRNGQTINWSSFNLPTSLSASVGGSTYNSTFSYGPDHQRYHQSATYSNGTENTSYAGGLLEMVWGSDSGGVHFYRHYIPTPSGLTIVVSRNDNGTTTTTYALSDHLGSSDAIVDGTTGNTPSTFGNVLVQESFGAFGLRRASNWTGVPSSGDYAVIRQTTRRGFTFHEELDNIALVHMNGRVYDPNVGRFLSADPMDGNQRLSQSWNRYSYVNNNPLTYIDPSGFDCAPVETSGAPTNDSPGIIICGSPVFPPELQACYYFGTCFEGEYCALAPANCPPSPLQLAYGGGSPTLPTVNVVATKTPCAIGIDCYLPYAPGAPSQEEQFTQCVRDALASASTNSESRGASGAQNAAQTLGVAHASADFAQAGSDTTLGKAFVGTPLPFSPAYTNAGYANAGATFRSILTSSGVVLRYTGLLASGVAVGFNAYQGGQQSGAPGAFEALGFGAVDLTVEALLSSTGVGAVAAIGYARAGGSRSVAAGFVVQGRLDACIALYGGGSLAIE